MRPSPAQKMPSSATAPESVQKETSGCLSAARTSSSLIEERHAAGVAAIGDHDVHHHVERVLALVLRDVGERLALVFAQIGVQHARDQDLARPLGPLRCRALRKSARARARVAGISSRATILSAPPSRTQTRQAGVEAVGAGSPGILVGGDVETLARARPRCASAPPASRPQFALPEVFR